MAKLRETVDVNATVTVLGRPVRLTVPFVRVRAGAVRQVAGLPHAELELRMRRTLRGRALVALLIVLARVRIASKVDVEVVA